MDPAAARAGPVLPPRPVRHRPGRLRRLPHGAEAGRGQGREPRPGDRHHLPARLRDGVGLPAHRRRGPARRRRARHRLPARARPLRRPRPRPRVLVPRAGRARRVRVEAVRLGVRRRPPGDPGLRADLRAHRSHPDLPGHRRSSRAGRRRRHLAPVLPLLPRRRARRLVLPRGPGHAEPARGVVGAQQVAEELELRRRPRPGLPVQHPAGHRRPAPRGDAGGVLRPDRAALPRGGQSVRPGALLRRLEPGPRLGLAAGPGGGGAQPQDRLEPDADERVAPQGLLPRLGRQDRAHDARAGG